MKVFKRVIIVLSIICYAAIFLYALILMPMLAKLTPISVEGSNLGKDFKQGSLFYYKKADSSELTPGYAVVYSDDDGGKEIGIIKENLNDIIAVYTEIVDQNGRNVGIDVKDLSVEQILGISKSSNFAYIGAYYSYINSHVAVIVLAGVILALRIMFIYVDPEKSKDDDDIEEKSKENKKPYRKDFNQEFIKEEEAPEDMFQNIFASKNSDGESVATIFAKDTTENAAESVTEPEEKEEDLGELIPGFDKILTDSVEETNAQAEEITSEDDAGESIAEETVQESAYEEADNVSKEAAEIEEETAADYVVESDANDEQDEENSTIKASDKITDFINKLQFDSKDDVWYKASQVDDALDILTAQVYDALNGVMISNEAEVKLQKLRDEKSALEKKYLIAESLLEEANEKIEKYEKSIESYKELEKRVEKLLAALKTGKNNG